MQKNSLLIMILEWLNNAATQRVKKYGAQYTTFGIFGLINYPLALIYEVFFINVYENLAIRILASFLCLGLVIQKYWPKDLIRFLPLYWFVTILLSLSTIATYSLLCSNFSSEYLTNYNVGVILVILLLDFTSFIIVTILGAGIGGLLFSMFSDTQLVIPSSEQLYLFGYMFFCITIFGSIFSRNKEIFVYYTQKAKDEINTQLESIIADKTIELTRALSAKTEFLNNMSHEVRTPIQGFVNVSEGLVNHWNEFDDKKRYDLAKNIDLNAKRLSSLVGSLLDLSKFSNEKILLDVKKFNIDKIIYEIIDESKSFYINEKKIKIEYIPSEVSFVSADKERIGQVLRNLLTNAIKFTPQDKEAVITITTKKEMRINNVGEKIPSLKISVKDQGVGIPEKELVSIFFAFNQSSRTKTKAGGTGLGLSICSEIIKCHNGDIWATNNPDVGSTFEFVIPINQEISSDNTKDHEIEKKIIKRRDHQSPKKILVIDDEETCLISVELLLTNTQYTLVKAQGGREGLRILNEQKDIDIILLDLMMPDIYGINVLKSIRENPETKFIPIILQSGSTDTDEIEIAMELGATRYIKKPYQRLELLSEINLILDQE